MHFKYQLNTNVFVICFSCVDDFTSEVILRQKVLIILPNIIHYQWHLLSTIRKYCQWNEVLKHLLTDC